ncbi:MAG: hypothetical protein JW910_22285 [Anaerolineae bacterium]|nr:hypothetical protein [Anaerolineae bacterium]
MSEEMKQPEESRPQEQPKPPAPPPPPPGQFQPPAQAPAPQRSQIQMNDILKQLEGLVAQLNIDLNMATKVLVFALLAGIVGALLDEVLSLPTNALVFTFGGLVAALVGPAYAFFKKKDDLPGLIMAAVGGLVTLLVWFIVMEIISDTWGLNVFKIMLTGAIVGMISFGWFALLRILPDKFLPR